MIRVLKHLHAASWLVQDSLHLQREDVRQAAHEFWDALFYWDVLPPKLRQAAEPIQFLILSKGSIDQTIATLTDAEVRHVAGLIRDFIFQADSGAEETGGEPA